MLSARYGELSGSLSGMLSARYSRLSGRLSTRHGRLWGCQLDTVGCALDARDCQLKPGLRVG